MLVNFREDLLLVHLITARSHELTVTNRDFPDSLGCLVRGHHSEMAKQRDFLLVHNSVLSLVVVSLLIWTKF